ncbi:AraC family transcriptional regulator [Siphonobacter curvatus]|uniref:HTH araC/xylS-type domain-containing protein n=1 Tax=Siphonobacter curvatus TaxID=2094562 RepID=A0A2S7IIG1_9BACT|nr:helix-turn-helix domain-containing protein [Siphonobacter curvatus]PQA55637.1 hypothetical protein C5O19_19700 [Siphonobacter curvatus]
MMESIGRRMTAAPELTDLIGHYYEIQTPSGFDPQVYHLSPSLEMMLAFNFGPPIRFSFGNQLDRSIQKIFILGPLRHMLTYELRANADLLIINFTHNGFYRLLAQSMQNLNLEEWSESKLLAQTQQLEELWQTLASFPDTHQRLEYLNSYLVSRLAPDEAEAVPLLTHAAAFHSPVVSPVKIIAAETNRTERTVQLRFKKYVGYSPKELLRFLRFKEVLHTLTNRSEASVNWFELIEQYGYHDQSHLIKDFQYYTGVSPRQFLKLSDAFCSSRD